MRTFAKELDSRLEPYGPDAIEYSGKLLEERHSRGRRVLRGEQARILALFYGWGVDQEYTERVALVLDVPFGFEPLMEPRRRPLRREQQDEG